MKEYDYDYDYELEIVSISLITKMKYFNLRIDEQSLYMQ